MTPALRLATPDDSTLVYELNFAPDVRARSTTAAVVPLADHERWFARRVAAPALWMIEDPEVGDAPVGTIRIDPIGERGDRAGRISIALARTARGLGIGRRAIADACRAWLGPVIAQIRPDNAASIASFVAAGFKRATPSAIDDPTLLTYTWFPEAS